MQHSQPSFDSTSKVLPLHYRSPSTPPPPVCSRSLQLHRQSRGAQHTAIWRHLARLTPHLAA